MKEPVDHVLRPRLPWRSPSEPAITECGYDASKVKTITREELVRRYKELGRQRCAMFTCMTCFETANRHATWEKDPRLALQRELTWEAPLWHGLDSERGHRLRDELQAIAELIAAHPEEFATILARLAWNEKKRQHRPAQKAVDGERDPFDARRDL